VDVEPVTTRCSPNATEKSCRGCTGPGGGGKLVAEAPLAAALPVRGVHLIRSVRGRTAGGRTAGGRTGRGLLVRGDRGERLLPTCLLPSRRFPAGRSPEDRAGILRIGRSRWVCSVRAATCSAVWHTTLDRFSPSVGACLRFPSGKQAVVGAAVGLRPGCTRRG